MSPQFTSEIQKGFMYIAHFFIYLFIGFVLAYIWAVGLFWGLVLLIEKGVRYVR